MAITANKAITNAACAHGGRDLVVSIYASFVVCLPAGYPGDRGVADTVVEPYAQSARERRRAYGQSGRGT